MRRTAGFRVAASVLVAAGVTLAALAGLAGGVFGGTQLRLTDGLFPSVGPDPRIAVVGIDDESLARFGRWPWDRDVHADLVRRLEGARAVAYDVTFAEPSQPEADGALAEAIGDAGNVVLAAQASFEGLPGDLLRAAALDPPIPELAEAAADVGHANIVPDPDGVVRSLPPVIETPAGDLMPSLTFALLALEEGDGAVTLRPDGVQVGARQVRTGPAHLMDINFTSGIPVFSAAEVLDGSVPPETFRDRIVLVGATAVGLGDVRLTPLDKATGEPGVMVHASALSTMLTGSYLSPEPMATTLVWVALLALLVALAVAFTRMWLSPVLAAALGAAFFLVAFRRFDQGEVMDLVYPTIAILLSYVAALGVRYFTEARERRRVLHVFSRYVAGDVVEEVLAAPEGALATLKGASRPMSVLFADLRGFTSASEGASPEDVVTALNVYLDAMTRAVTEERGTIDKFMGDCVMAFWGAPREDPEHAQRACRAALRMVEYIDAAMETEEARLLQVAGCGIGVASGNAVVGNIGSADRLDYTAIGDTVNVASRICGVAAAGQIVVTEETASTVEGEIPLAPLPPLAVKGKASALRVFQLVREGEEPPSFEPGYVIEAEGEKGHFEPEAETPKAAGYAPVEPVGGEGERK